MSFLTEIEAELARAEASVKAKFEALSGTALAEAKAELAKLSDEAKAALADAKTKAITEVQQNEPGIAAQVQKYLDEIEAAVLASLGGGLVA